MSSKPKVALYWCASCGGCEEAVVDLAEGLLTVAGQIDIVFWPVALDFKKKDIQAIPDGHVVASLINGAVRTSEQEEMARLLRRKSQLVIAYGSCAHLGGIPGLANLRHNRQAIFDYVYSDCPSASNPAGVVPRTRSKIGHHEIELPRFYDRVLALDSVIDVDYYLPGCPPTPRLTLEAINALLEGNLPHKGTVLAGTRALCHECPLDETKPGELRIDCYKRPHEVILDRQRCYLAQGVVCMGPLTRGGCEALCIQGGMPCTGCFGPMDAVVDVGAKAVSAFAAAVNHHKPEAVVSALEGIPDPAGTFYRYSQPASLLARKARTLAVEAGAEAEAEAQAWVEPEAAKPAAEAPAEMTPALPPEPSEPPPAAEAPAEVGPRRIRLRRRPSHLARGRRQSREPEAAKPALDVPPPPRAVEAPAEAALEDEPTRVAPPPRFEPPRTVEAPADMALEARPTREVPSGEPPREEGPPAEEQVEMEAEPPRFEPPRTVEAPADMALEARPAREVPRPPSGEPPRPERPPAQVVVWVEAKAPPPSGEPPRLEEPPAEVAAWVEVEAPPPSGEPSRPEEPPAEGVEVEAEIPPSSGEPPRPEEPPAEGPRQRFGRLGRLLLGRHRSKEPRATEPVPDAPAFKPGEVTPEAAKPARETPRATQASAEKKSSE